jgi:hypothetical protein
MKKIFTLLTLLFAGAAAANAVNITVNVTNDGAVYAQYYDNTSYTQVNTDLVKGDNSFDLPEYTSLYFYTNTGYVITSYSVNDAAQSLSNNSYAYYYVQSSSEGAKISIDAKTIADASDAKAYVTIDDPTKVQMRIGSRSIDLTEAVANAEFEVPYISASETNLQIGPATYGDTFYKVTLNDETVASNYGYYYITLSDGAKINVQTAFPDINANVTFTIGEGAEDFFTSVTAAGEEIENFVDGFTAKVGSTIVLTAANSSDYKFESLKVNDTTVSYFSGSYSFTLTEDTSIEINAHKYGTIKGIINIDNPENVIVYKGYSYNGTVIEGLKAGDNEIEVSENNSQITIAAASDCYLTSVLQGETEKYSSGSTSVTVYLSDGANITVKSGVIERNSTFALYIDDVTKANYSFSFQRADRSSITATSGYNIVKFDPDIDTQFQVGGYGSELTFNAYQNDEAITLSYVGATYCTFTAAEGDVIKVFLTGEPASHSVTFTTNVAESTEISVTKDVIVPVTDLTTALTALDGTQIDIKAEGTTVKVNGEAITADEETGIFTITVSADTEISIEGESSAISEINAASAAAAEGIYDLQGRRVARAAHGIYIINGQKTIIK